jgi:H+-translocating NAD(P) transhydrogenase subunit alpha
MLLTNLGTLVLAGFLGYAVISKVPATPHTPLMSGTNAIHGIVMVAGITLLVTGAASDALTQAIVTIAVVLGAINVVGGFMVTDRMLEMFKSRPGKECAAYPARSRSADPGVLMGTAKPKTLLPAATAGARGPASH